MADAALIGRLLDVIEHDIMPKTEAGVSAGNKLFGAAILRKDDLSVVIAETNNEMENPLWHGEVHCLKRFYECRARTARTPRTASSSPRTSLARSASPQSPGPGSTISGSCFSHEDSRDAFAIPHDLRILKEVFTLDPEWLQRLGTPSGRAMRCVGKRPVCRRWNVTAWKPGYATSPPATRSSPNATRPRRRPTTFAQLTTASAPLPDRVALLCESLETFEVVLGTIEDVDRRELPPGDAFITSWNFPPSASRAVSLIAGEDQRRP